jgi:signal transduction histidine kinase
MDGGRADAGDNSLSTRLAEVEAELARTRTALETTKQALAERDAALTFLEEATELLGSSLNYESTLTSIVDLAVPRIAEYCTVDLSDGVLFERLATKHINPDKLELTNRLQKLLGGQGARGVAHTLRTGQTHLTPEITDDMWRASALNTDHLEVLRALGHKSMLRVPLKVGARVVGAISFFSEVPNRFSPADVRLAEDLGMRASMAIESARLYKEARAAEESLRALNAELEERVKERTSQLAEANHELERANRRKSAFLANMSHELRTPLNAIIGFSEIMIDTELGSVDADTQAEFLVNIHASGRHLLGIINDLLDLSKVEAGKMDIYPQTLELFDTLRSCVETIRPLAVKKDVALTLSCAERAHAWGDPSRVKQIVINLLSNAVKFTPPGGSVSVTADGDVREVRIAVRDTGIGIKPEDQAVIFDEFRQVDAARTRQYEGTGLGLALVKRMVELQGGNVSLESVPGEGSCFTVTLPAAKAPKSRNPRRVSTVAG